MSCFEDYCSRFQTVAFERRDGILLMRVHRDGGEASWAADEGGMNGELGQAFAAVAGDPENRVIIFTGTGDSFIAGLDLSRPFPDIENIAFWGRIERETREMTENLLKIPVPIIGAVNGPAYIHAELIAMSDIVIASERARFADKGHIVLNGVAPGDGAHAWWPLVLGPNRARYFLLTGEEIDAHEGKRIGFVGEVLPHERLLDRAWELARELLGKPDLSLRFTRQLMTRSIKRAFASEHGYGLSLEALSALDLIRRQSAADAGKEGA
jgi:enoyl-CoA hydratase/carnithine racemase